MPKQTYLVVAGILTAILVNASYAYFGFSIGVFLLWLGAIALAGFGFYYHQRGEKLVGFVDKFDKWDVGILFTFLIILSPLYLYKLYEIPWQINTDEIVITNFARELVRAVPNVDFFGIMHNYFGFPTLIFASFGRLADWLGGVDLAHFRLVHALFGLMIALAAYIFFRLLVPRTQAVIMTCLVSFNHALVAISRMSMRDNTGLLVELIALCCLVYGFKTQNHLSVFLGGVVAGLGFYTYFPARITIIVWGLVVGLIVLFTRFRRWRESFIHLGIAALGLILVAGPVLIATLGQNESAAHYQRQQFLFLEEGRQLEMEWTSKPNGKEAWITNIKQGLTMFNKPRHDEGYIYPNYNHSFTDTITGWALWLGVLIVFWRLVRRRQSLGDILGVIGFLFLYLVFAFLITKAPNYTRLLVILPFVAYLAGTAVWWAAGILSKLFVFLWAKKRAELALASVITSTIVVSNLLIFNDFVVKGLNEGNDVGSTGRFVEERAANLNHEFYIAADKTYPYYSWGGEDSWMSWAGFFARDRNRIQVIGPDSVANIAFRRPFTVFMSGRLWSEKQEVLRANFPDMQIYYIKSDGSLVAASVE